MFPCRPPDFYIIFFLQQEIAYFSFIIPSCKIEHTYPFCGHRHLNQWYVDKFTEKILTESRFAFSCCHVIFFNETRVVT